MSNPLLFIPNLIGYARLLSFGVGMVFVHSNPLTFICLYCFAMFLDLFDGIAARAFNQCSKFGEMLDVFTDNIQRSAINMIISSYYPSLLPLFLWMTVEDWICMICVQSIATLKKNHAKKKTSNWKGDIGGDTEMPAFVLKIFENNFKNWLGVWVILGLSGIGPYLYLSHHFSETWGLGLTTFTYSAPFDASWLWLLFGVYLVIGRVFASISVYHVVKPYFKLLLAYEA
jgi:phosphatidylglycerophosphate synthase